ncbi:hypothetical protein IFM89_011522 [Coptis chinensis]|uniref:Folate-biopterin transporter 7 n=1 Tax=Coptis chinensis TaxID=261450 RepID=A0A835IW37_9MAGN|nr:hypothetical protein IFM89_011522 [Coptis chinensis]
MVSSVEGGVVLKTLVGLGCLVQGVRCLPWMAVNFFLKDQLKLHPSTLQLLQNSSNLPMVAKPLYGLLSDAVYISGQHRIPYIAIGVFLQAVSWIAIALLPPSIISIFSVTILLLLSNLGASIVEVVNDALVAEAGKEPGSSSRNPTKSPSGELQSFVWMCGSIGGVLGNLIGGVAIDRFSSQTIFLVFGLLLVIQLLTTITVRENSLSLPVTSSSNGIRKQLSELVVVLRKPDIAYSIAWLAASYAVIPILTGTMFFYQTEHLNLDSSVVGISKVFGQVALLTWSVIYNKHLKSIPQRKLISAIQAVTAIFMVSDALFVKRIYLKFGIPDSVYVIIFSGTLEVLSLFKVLPFSVLFAQLCPQGCEGSLMAFLMSTLALANIMSGYLGVALASFLGISGKNFSWLPSGIIIQAVCTVLPLFWSSWIPGDIKLKKKD